MKRLLFILTALALLALASGVVLVAAHVYRPYKGYTLPRPRRGALPEEQPPST